jgi:hypothetical protein
MKIGIITFHWGANYGGVLQAFALQEVLKKLGADVEVINYVPRTYRDSFLRCFWTIRPARVFQHLKDYFKNKNIEKFRKNFLSTTRRYLSLQDLQKESPKFDVYISGSDQVWNPYILNSYGMPYFLPFGDNSVKRISYAISFACLIYPSNAMSKIKPYLKAFNAISVRENSGINILKGAGIEDAKLMPDPTLLLETKDLEKIMTCKAKQTKDYVFFYVLHSNQKLMYKIYKYISDTKKKNVINTEALKFCTMGIDRWLQNLRDSNFVITNSFHGVIFSMLFRKQFVVIPVEGRFEDMNDRIYTLLEKFGLKDRVFNDFDSVKLFQIIDKPIDWVSVSKRQKEMQKEAFDYFDENIFNVKK